MYSTVRTSARIDPTSLKTFETLKQRASLTSTTLIASNVDYLVDDFHKYPDFIALHPFDALLCPVHFSFVVSFNSCIIQPPFSLPSNLETPFLKSCSHSQFDTLFLYRCTQNLPFPLFFKLFHTPSYHILSVYSTLWPPHTHAHGVRTKIIDHTNSLSPFPTPQHSPTQTGSLHLCPHPRRQIHSFFNLRAPLPSQIMI